MRNRTHFGIVIAEPDHASETKAYGHLLPELREGRADTAKVMQWEGGRWWHFETVHADEIRAVQAANKGGVS